MLSKKTNKTQQKRKVDSDSEDEVPASKKNKKASPKKVSFDCLMNF